MCSLSANFSNNTKPEPLSACSHTPLLYCLRQESSLKALDLRTCLLQVKHVKEYVRGAFQALAWARMILSNVKDTAQLEKVLGEVDKALETLRGTAAKDFLTDMQTELKSE
jgi:hypothetical protein